MKKVNSLLSEVITATFEREMALQSVIGAQIFERYGISGSIDQVNENHRMSLQAFYQKWGGQV
ncbi:hypothetical protein ACQCN2_00870 [Brevibacillus ginsengisoli]|uniref:hypothetical protein n=1 Tax=Brevibacillus ginsengisoli TaxID=363854 RepID=UPI003CFBAD2F